MAKKKVHKQWKSLRKKTRKKIRSVKTPSARYDLYVRT